jgi:hypothetical protein
MKPSAEVDVALAALDEARLAFVIDEGKVELVEIALSGEGGQCADIPAPKEAAAFVNANAGDDLESKATVLADEEACLDRGPVNPIVSAPGHDELARS